MLINLDNCVRCYACELSCREEHALSTGTTMRWCRVKTVEPRRISGELHMDFVPTLCFQCERPTCAAFCPFEAISKGEDGMVRIDETRCTGCKLCIEGCPFGVIYYDETKMIAGKCDLCLERTRSGLEPSCVQHCIGGALQFLNLEELNASIAGVHSVRMGKICYASSKWKLGKITPYLRVGTD